MTEILTESFCERCGTRYTFESARPRIRLKGVKVLTRGLKNFVLSDDTSMDEAMAAARSESDREATGHQLDAFHKTFSFCMSCRQYTCPNCWNEAEARCMSCAPLALPEAPAEIDVRMLSEAFLVGHVTPVNGNGNHEHDGWPPFAEATETTEAVTPTIQAGLESATGLEAEIEPEPMSSGEADVEPFVAVEAQAAPVVEAEAAPEPIVEAEAETEPASADASVEPVFSADSGVEPIADAEPEETPSIPTDAIGKAAAQTVGLFRRFRAGQSLDAELDAYEHERLEAAAASDAATAEATRDALSALEQEPVAAELSVVEVEAAETAADAEMVEAAETAPELIEMVAAAPELIEMVAAAPEPAVEAAEAAPEPEVGMVEAAPEPETELAIEAEPAVEAEAPLEPAIETAAEPAIETPPQRMFEPEPLAAATAADVVEQPTWRITAPDATGTPPTVPQPEPGGGVPVQASAAGTELPTGEPQWPARAEWPTSTPAAGLPFLGRLATPNGGIDALWAASNQQLVTAPPAPGRAASGIQPCVSCGLSLSATARFCRRCGTSQSR